MTHIDPQPRWYLLLIPVIWVNLVALVTIPSVRETCAVLAIVFGAGLLVAHTRHAARIVDNAPKEK